MSFYCNFKAFYCFVLFCFFHSSKLAVSSGNGSFPFIWLYNRDLFSLHLYIRVVTSKLRHTMSFFISGLVAALRNLYIVCSICVFALTLCDYVKAIIYWCHSHWTFCKTKKLHAAFLPCKICFLWCKNKIAVPLIMTVLGAFLTNTSSSFPGGWGWGVCVLEGGGEGWGMSPNTNVSTWSD